jgi:hypothetical protein
MGLTQYQETVPAKACEYSVLRIGRQCGWPARDLPRLWVNREQLYFFIWRDIELRYKQTVIGDAWAVLQHVMAIIAFGLFSVKVTNQYSVRLIQSTIHETAVPIGNSL